MVPFDPQSYGPTMSALIDLQQLGELGPFRPETSVRAELAALHVDAAFAPHTIHDRQMANCCLAGLWLGHGFLDESHSICQAIPTATGSFWHAVMHRREADFSNSKYWFRRVGGHPVFEPLAEAAREIAISLSVTGSAAYLATPAAWDPFRFVDLCQSVQRGEAANREACQQVSRVEWQLLFEHCYRQAIAPSAVA